MSIPTHERIVWSDAQPLPEPGDGYSHWEAATKTEQLRAVMVFAELRESASVTSLRDAILALQAEPMARMQASELDALDAEIAALDEMARGKGSSEAGDLSPPPPAFPWPVRVAVFWLGALDELPDYCRLIHVGPRVARLNEADPATAIRSRAMPRPGGARHRSSPPSMTGSVISMPASAAA